MLCVNTALNEKVNTALSELSELSPRVNTVLDGPSEHSPQYTV